MKGKGEVAFPYHFINTGKLLGEAAFMVQIPRSFLRGVSVSEVLVAFAVDATKGKGLLIRGGTDCNALYNSCACCFFFFLLVLASRRLSLNVRHF